MTKGGHPKSLPERRVHERSSLPGVARQEKETTEAGVRGGVRVGVGKS